MIQSGRGKPCLGVVEVRKLLHADILDRVMQVWVAVEQEADLIVEMAVNGRLYRRGAGPDALATGDGDTYNLQQVRPYRKISVPQC